MGERHGNLYGLVKGVCLGPDKLQAQREENNAKSWIEFCVCLFNFTNNMYTVSELQLRQF